MSVYSIKEKCTHCGGLAEHGFGESLNSQFVAWESRRCACGLAMEADGPLDQELRAHILRVGGAFRVDVQPKSKVGVLRVFRSTFELSLPDAARAFEALPSFRANLTRTEAERIALQFPADAADVLIVADSDEPEADAARNAVSSITLKCLRALLPHEGIDELILLIGATCLGLARTHAVDSDRVACAMVRVSGGRVAALRDAVEVAKTDWRDLLVAAGFAVDPLAHLAWQPVALTEPRRRRWKRGELFLGISFAEGQQVTAPSGPATVTDLVALEPEPRYLVRGADGTESEVSQSRLAP